MHPTGVHVEPRLAQPLATLEHCSNGLGAAIAPYRHTGTGALEAGGRLYSTQAEDFEVWQLNRNLGNYCPFILQSCKSRMRIL